MKKISSFLLGLLLIFWGWTVAFSYVSEQIDPQNREIVVNGIFGETGEEKRHFSDEDKSDWLHHMEYNKLQRLRSFFETEITREKAEEEKRLNRSLTQNEVANLSLVDEFNQVQTLFAEITQSETLKKDEDRLDAMRAEIQELSKIYGSTETNKQWTKLYNGFSKVTPFILTLFLLYLSFVLYRFVFLEKTKLEADISPFHVVLFLCGVVYLGYNVNFFVNAIDAISGIDKNDFFQVQGTFILLGGKVLLTYSLITLSSVIIGDKILSYFQFAFSGLAYRFLIALSVGLSVLIFGVFCLAFFSLYSVFVVLPLLLFAIWYFRKESKFWIQAFFKKSIYIDQKFFSLNVFLCGVILVFLHIDVIALFRPVPTGWDSINAYQNTAKLIGNYGHLIGDVHNYNWELLMSLGHVFWNSSMVSLFLSFYGFLLVVFSLFLFIRKYVVKGGGVLAVAIYISLPMVQHFSSSDMKIDNALFFYFVVALICFFQWAQVKCLDTEEQEKNANDAVLQKFCMPQGIVQTSIFAIGMILFYIFVTQSLPLYSSLKTSFFSFSLQHITGSLSFFTALLFFIYALYSHFFSNSLKKDHLAKANKSEACLAVEIPKNWTWQELLQKNKWLFLCGLLLGMALGIKLTTIFVIFSLCLFISFRFWGWVGVFAILFLQVYIFSKTNQVIHITDLIAQETYRNTFLYTCLLFGVGGSVAIGVLYRKTLAYTLGVSGIFLAFCLLPLTPWFAKNTYEILRYSPHQEINTNTVLTGWNKNKPQIDIESIDIDMSQCRSTAQTEELGRYFSYSDGSIGSYIEAPWRLTMNTAGVKGFYVNISFIFLAFLPFMFFFLHQIVVKRRLKLLGVFTLLTAAVWIFSSGKGIVWYTLGSFVGFLGFTELFIVYVRKNVILYSFCILLLFLSFFMSVSMRLQTWQNPVLWKYAYGESSADKVLNEMLPNYLNIRNDLDAAQIETPDTPYLYRIGTFITYFINNSDQVIGINDNQLDFFNCLIANKSNDEVVDILKSLGFRYIMMDLFTATIEKNPEGSLHKKVDRFLDFVNASDRVDIVYPTVPKERLEKYPFLSEKIPSIQKDLVKRRIIHVLPDPNKQMEERDRVIRHSGYVFLELL